MDKITEDDVIRPLLPSSIKSDTTVNDIAKAYNPNLIDVATHLNDAIFLARLDELSSRTLDHLAKQWQVHVWRDSWPIDTKRKVLRALITEKTHLGTLSAVKNVLEAFGTSAIVREWWETEPKGVPHTFQIYIDQQALIGIAEAEQLEDTYEMIHYTKPVRSQFTLSVIESGSATLKLIDAGRASNYARITFSQSGAITSAVMTRVYKGANPILVRRLSNF